VLLADPKAATKAERKRAKEVMQQAIFEFSGTPQVMIPSPLPGAVHLVCAPRPVTTSACCMLHDTPQEGRVTIANASLEMKKGNVEVAHCTARHGCSQCPAPSPLLPSSPSRRATRFSEWCHPPTYPLTLSHRRWR